WLRYSPNRLSSGARQLPPAGDSGTVLPAPAALHESELGRPAPSVRQPWRRAGRGSWSAGWRGTAVRLVQPHRVFSVPLLGQPCAAVLLRAVSRPARGQPHASGPPGWALAVKSQEVLS